MQSEKKRTENLRLLYTRSDVINDNNTSQPIAASESGLIAQSANWSWAEVIILLVKRKYNLTLS